MTDVDPSNFYIFEGQVVTITWMDYGQYRDAIIEVCPTIQTREYKDVKFISGEYFKTHAKQLPKSKLTKILFG